MGPSLAIDLVAEVAVVGDEDAPLLPGVLENA